MVINAFVIAEEQHGYLLLSDKGIFWLPAVRSVKPQIGTLWVFKIIKQNELFYKIVAGELCSLTLLPMDLLRVLQAWLPRPLFGQFLEDESIESLYYHTIKAANGHEDILEYVKQILFKKVLGSDPVKTDSTCVDNKYWRFWRKYPEKAKEILECALQERENALKEGIATHD